MTRQSITSGIGLRARGQQMYEDQQQQEHLERQQSFAANPDAWMSNPLGAYMARRPLPREVPDVAGMHAWLGLLGPNVKMKGGPSAPGSNQLAGLPANSLIGDDSLLNIPNDDLGSTLFAPGQMEGGPRGLSFEQVQGINNPQARNQLGPAALRGLLQSGRVPRARRR